MSDQDRRAARFGASPLITVLFVAILPSAASAFCLSKPSAPYCAAGYRTFDSISDFNRCRDEVISYRDEVRRYLQCRKDEDDQVIRELNDAIEEFNRRAR